MKEKNRNIDTSQMKEPTPDIIWYKFQKLVLESYGKTPESNAQPIQTKNASRFTFFKYKKEPRDKCRKKCEGGRKNEMIHASASLTDSAKSKII